MDSKILSDLGSSVVHDSKTGSKAGRAESARRSLCLFRVGADSYALDVSYVGEVLTVNRVTNVPMTPPGVIGLYNLRGVALAIVDLAALLDLAAESDGLGRNSKDYSVLVLRFDDGLSVGVPIHHVESILNCDQSQIRPSAAQGEHPVISGVLDLDNTREGRMASIIDGEALKQRLESLRFVSRKSVSA